jgi:hypothetical protein
MIRSFIRLVVLAAGSRVAKEGESNVADVL